MSTPDLAEARADLDVAVRLRGSQCHSIVFANRRGTRHRTLDFSLCSLDTGLVGASRSVVCAGSMTCAK